MIWTSQMYYLQYSTHSVSTTVASGLVYYQIHRAGCGPLPRCVDNYREIVLYLKQSRALKFRLHALPKTPTIPFRIRFCLNLITTTRLMIFDKMVRSKTGPKPVQTSGTDRVFFSSAFIRASVNSQRTVPVERFRKNIYMWWHGK